MRQNEDPLPHKIVLEKGGIMSAPTSVTGQIAIGCFIHTYREQIRERESKKGTVWPHRNEKANESDRDKSQRLGGAYGFIQKL